MLFRAFHILPRWAIFLLVFFAGVGVSVAATPVITELVASNGSSLLDEDGDSPDWFEIYNPDPSNSVDLANWSVTDDASAPRKWVFPSLVIPPGGHVVVFASDKNRALAGQPLHTNFKLTSNGEYLGLIDPQGQVISEFNPYPALERDVSYGLIQSLVTTNPVIDEGADARMLIPSAPVAGWTASSFDDSSWSEVVSGIGYERSSGNDYDPFISTDIESIFFGQASTVMLRYRFDLADLPTITELRFLAKFDDAFVAYLNGQEVARDNFAGTPVWDSIADSSQEAVLSSYREWDISAAIPLLVGGENVLAIHAINRFSTSSDFLMLPKLELTREADLSGDQYGFFQQPTPGALNNTQAGQPAEAVIVSEPSGVKTGPVSVSLSTATGAGEIRYTLDGSEPSQSSPVYQGSLQIDDPVRLRARAYEVGRLPGKVAAADYSFLDSSLTGYLSDVPVVVMDNFGSGAYPNKGRSNDGRDVIQVPRQLNVMSIFEPGTDSQPFAQAAALQARTGCRVRGSSSSTFPRKSLSVEFWDENDDDLDLSPFGMQAEADWVLYAPYQIYDRSLIHNTVTFDFARMVKALAPESRVVVVFQNTDGGKVGAGDLEGVYIWMEKIERNRIGLDFDELDVAGQNGGWMVNIDRMEAIPEGMPADTIQPNFHAAGPDGILSIPDDEQNSGGSQSVDDISEFYHSYLNFAEPNGYGISAAQRNTVQTEVRAMDAAVWSPGFRDQVGGYRAHLDPESWARFYAVQNFSANQDATVLSTFIFKPSPAERIKMGPVWDFDRAYTWRYSATSNPLIFSDRDWFQGLFADIDFHQLHQDIWQEARVERATDQQLLASVGQAAAGLRPDQIQASGLDYATWQARVDSMKSWMVARANYLDSQYEPLPLVNPESGPFGANLSVTISTQQGGTAYFTTDGTDPRLPGGGISPAAQIYTGSLNLTGRTRLLVRVRDGIRWSGLVERNFFQPEALPRLVVSELSYQPSAPSALEESLGFEQRNDFEFIEILNIGDQTADLSTLEIAGGVSFDFSAASMGSLAPGGRVLVVEDLDAFLTRFGSGLPVVGVYSGALSDGGETVILRDKLLDLDLQNFSYSDQAPWPVEADGDGFSLVLKNPETDPDHQLASNWRGSRLPTANPGTSDAVPAFTGSPLADADGDGLVALVEHYLGSSDQNRADGSGRIEWSAVTAADGLTYPSVALRYRVGADDYELVPRFSLDLIDWGQPMGNLVRESFVRHADGEATVVYRSIWPQDQPQQFMKIEIWAAQPERQKSLAKGLIERAALLASPR